MIQDEGNPNGEIPKETLHFFYIEIFLRISFLSNSSYTKFKNVL